MITIGKQMLSVPRKHLGIETHKAHEYIGRKLFFKVVKTGETPEDLFVSRNKTLIHPKTVKHGKINAFQKTMLVSAILVGKMSNLPYRELNKLSCSEAQKIVTKLTQVMNSMPNA